MLDEDQSKSEEERIEGIRFEVNRLFDDLELKITDPTLAEQLDQQKKIMAELLSQTNQPKELSTKELPPEVKKELGQYFRLLEIEEAQFKDPLEQSLAQLRVAISHSKAYYDLGQTNIAFELLDDPEEGALTLADNMSSWSEEHLKMYNDVNRLDDLLYELLKNK